MLVARGRVNVEQILKQIGQDNPRVTKTKKRQNDKESRGSRVENVAAQLVCGG